MPESLWAHAVALARVRGVHSVARAVRLDYYSLKRRLTASTPASQQTQRFVELSVMPGAGETLVPVAAGVELEHRDGRRMRVQSVTAAGLAALCETFWRQRGRA